MYYNDTLLLCHEKEIQKRCQSEPVEDCGAGHSTHPSTKLRMTRLNDY
jgi:hypothetical protein